MRFYEGYLYDIWTAVYPKQKGLRYQIMSVRDGKKHEKAYVKLGHERELDVEDCAKLIWREGTKSRVIKIPFVREEGRLVFDLPAYLKERKISFTLYKRLTNCAGDPWYRVVCPAIISSAGEISWGGDRCIDYYEYWLNVLYRKNNLQLGGKRVKWFQICRETIRMNQEEILHWFQNSMETGISITFEEMGNLLEQWGIHKDSPFLEIEFCDGKVLTGKEIWSKEIGGNCI